MLSWVGCRFQRSKAIVASPPPPPSPDVMRCSWLSTPPAGESWRFGRCSRGLAWEPSLWANTAGTTQFQNENISSQSKSSLCESSCLEYHRSVCSTLRANVHMHALAGCCMLATVWWGWTVWPARAGSSTPSRCVCWIPSQEHWGQWTSPSTWPSGWYTKSHIYEPQRYCGLAWIFKRTVQQL